jgi:ketosteroid isomerase-like protein
VTIGAVGTRILPAALLSLTACGGGTDAVTVTPVGYREAAAALDGAIASKDRASLERLIAPDFLWIRGSGAKGNKAAFVGALTVGTIRIEPFRPSDARWIVAGDTALLTATNTLRGEAEGQPFVDRHRFADHWLYRDGRWQLVYAQVTPIAADQ